MSEMGKRFRRYIGIAQDVFKSFIDHKMGFQCVALSYFCTMALIPMLALLFVVSGGLGVSDRISDMLYKVMPAYPELIDYLLSKADNVISELSKGWVGIISAIVFFWSVVWMFFQIERVFNNAWGIDKVPRNIIKRFSFYIAALFLLPLLIALFSLGIMAYSNSLTLLGLHFRELKVLPVILLWMAFYLLAVLILSLLYKMIPATKVIYRYALSSSLLTAAVFSGFQYLYLQTQVFVTHLNAVYGIIAAVPLFLMWLNFSWQIIMYGAELSYSLQKADGLIESI